MLWLRSSVLLWPEECVYMDSFSSSPTPELPSICSRARSPRVINIKYIAIFYYPVVFRRGIQASRRVSMFIHAYERRHARVDHSTGSRVLFCRPRRWAASPWFHADLKSLTANRITSPFSLVFYRSLKCVNLVYQRHTTVLTQFSVEIADIFTTVAPSHK